MLRPLSLRLFLATLISLAVAAGPVRAADPDGRWSIGVNPGMYKLVLTDHSDAWTPGWLVNADVKYGLTSNWLLGVEGSWMKTYLADLSGKDPGDGAGMSFDKIPDGPQQRGTVIGLVADYQFSKDSTWSPFVSLGTGMYFWKWTDADGNTLSSDDPALDDPRGGVRVPDVDNAGNPYELKDQELYVLLGTGLDYFASDAFSIGLGVNFRYLTHVFTDFTGEKDIVGSDPGQLDLPRGIVEGLLAFTFHFGGKCPEMSATATAAPGSGPIPVDVQFQSAVVGGCPDYTYAWDFGDGATSTEANPKHAYDKEGNYTASLTVKDKKGNQAIGSATITANCPPLTATASGNATSGTAPFTVLYQATASGGCPPITYAWDFGDGATSSEQNPSHQYSLAGDYPATLTVTDSKGVSTKSGAGSVAVASPLVPTPGKKSVVMKGVNFQSGKAVLLPESIQNLDQVAEILLANPEINVEVGGHTDSDGTASFNQQLSEKRANTVRDYLIKKGVPAERLTAKGYGETEPIADNATKEGKAENRRVELKPSN